MIIQNVSVYSDFTPVEIEWSIFRDRWISGLAKDEILIGVNWSGKTAKGLDIDPTKLKYNVEAYILFMGKRRQALK